MILLNRKTIFGVLLMTGWLRADPAQLVKDSSFQMIPAAIVTEGPEVENHGGAYVFHVRNTKSVIPFWEVTGVVDVWQWKRDNTRLVDLRGGQGSISQTVPTEKGKTYSLTFRVRANGEGPKGQSMVAKFGSQSRVFPDSSFGFQSLKFEAKGPTVLSFAAASKSPTGPLIDRVHCVEFDPEAEKIEMVITEFYRDMDRGEKSEKDIAKLTAHFSDDFRYQPLEGAALDKAGYEELVRQRITKNFKVNTAIDDLSVNADGSVTIEVERRQKEPGDYGTLKTSAPHFKQTWVKIGNEWKMKSSEELKTTE